MIDPTKPLEVVHSKDPALDPSMDWVEYLRTRDPALIKDSPTKKATRFVLHPLSGTSREDIDDRYQTLSARHRAAFQVAIRQIIAHSSTEEVPTIKVGEYRVCTAEWYESFKVKYGLNFIYTLGSIAYALSGEPSTDPFLDSRSDSQPG